MNATMLSDLALLPEEKAVFERDGVVGPFKLWDADDMRAFWRELRAEVLNPMNNKFAVFDNPINYDRHLDISLLSRLVSEPAIVRKLQGLLGPDILCWRTEWFPKNPGEPGTGWHQVETYRVGEIGRPSLERTRNDEGVPMELTVWVALTEATKENGCLRFIPGSHRTWYYNEHGHIQHASNKKDADPLKHSFFGYDYSELKLSPDWEPEEQQMVHFEMQPGEFVIFTARCVHGSLPNTSRKQRMGFTIRVVPTHVQVYSGMSEFDEFGHHFDLSRYACVLIAGEDAYGHNRIASHNAHGEPFKTLPRLELKSLEISHI